MLLQPFAIAFQCVSTAKPVAPKSMGRILMTEIIYKEESYRIIGACFEVYKEMGCGFLEPVYLLRFDDQ